MLDYLFPARWHTPPSGRTYTSSTDDAIAVTAGQVHEVVARIIAAGHWANGDPDIPVIFDVGYD